jgi:hypothetical protein
MVLPLQLLRYYIFVPPSLNCAVCVIPVQLLIGNSWLKYNLAAAGVSSSNLSCRLPALVSRLLRWPVWQMKYFGVGSGVLLHGSCTGYAKVLVSIEQELGRVLLRMLSKKGS